LVLITLLLLFVALFAIWRKRRRAILIACAVVFWLLGSWLSGPLLAWAQSGYEQSVPPKLAARTTFILVGGGTQHDRDGRLVPMHDAGIRIEATAALYRKCRQVETSCRVIISGGNPQRHELAEADDYAPFLIDRGVSAADLVLENTSRNTYENARNVAKLLQPGSYDTLVAVTSAYQMRRALLAFDAFGLHPQPFVSNARQPKSWRVPHPEGWSDSNSALHELIGIARFRIWRFLGLY
jgi:uncharacterized SAM-binding protein YcdF (DUF218 family)